MLSFPLGPVEAMTAFLIALAAAVLQSVAGFGLALVTAPLLLLIDGSFVPGPVMAGGLVLTCLILIRDHQHADVSGLTYALFGRATGTVGAAAFLLNASDAVFDLTFAVLVMFAVILSAAGLEPRPNRKNAVIAGILSGLMGTISSIGGPPIALLYQNAGASRLRGTLAGFFLVGSLVSLLALVFVGRFGSEELVLSVFLALPMALGFHLGGPLRTRMSDRAVRPMVLGLSFISGMIVLLRVVF
jgi:uncharacterized membrane protein YfcA